MSDPLSVTGSAVGIISLGLQVCGEIVSFCQAWCGFNEDLESLGQKADGLRMPLRTLRDLIEDFHTTDPAIASDLENKAKIIEQVVKRLKKAKDRYASDPDSLRFQLKRAAYPFRKEGLRDMANDLDSFQTMLQTALHIYSTQNARDSAAPGILGTVMEKWRNTRDTPEDLKLIVDLAQQQFQQAFDRQEASPFDRIQDSDEENSLFDLACKRLCINLGSKDFEQYSSILMFLLDCGSKPSKEIDLMFGHTLFGGEGSLGLRLLDLGCSFTTHVPRSLSERQSILYLLSRGDDSIHIPNIARIILQESEDELRDALKSGTASPNDIIKGHYLINYAFGWPEGIQTLLEAGARPNYGSFINFVEDNNTEDTYHSIKLLIEAGWPFDWVDISECQRYGGSGKIKSLLIKELAARRKRLWHLAQSCLPAGQLPKLISEDKSMGITTIFDMHTAEIHARVVKQGVSIDISLHLDSYSEENVHESVYHYPEFTAQTLEELYHIGFRGITQVNYEGLMPLVISYSGFDIFIPEKYKMSKVMERMVWLVSKGADVYQGVPGTNATAAHHLGFIIVDIFLDKLIHFGEFESYHNEQYRAWKQNVSKFGKDIFLLPSVRDGCVCACSPGGCTTMSVTVRHIIHYFFQYKRIDNPDFWFRELMQFLLWWARGDTEIGWGIIRFLTFDALGLKHSCCIRTHPYLFSTNLKLESREEEEVEEIFEEQKLGLLEFEKVLDELKIKFDELGLPVMEFLEGYWHTRMIEILSQRDPYDEQHVIKSRQIGVMLEPDECVVPDRVSLLIGSKTIHEIST
ncbi:hypothetical protein PITC_056520 [Penicillium italicum]|uniref:Fungal N-terminal domain-containing protein n=1 Tax=Penicillium italicum TaxID=40296 RepID=A0A0A2L0M0_PENIT|nr:hypothetical protein PITC_056520 [Penicillium italicum]